MTILRANPIRLDLQVSEMDAARIHTGMTVVARAAARPEREFTGKVTVLSPAVDPSSRAMTIRAEFANPSLELRPGMSATVRVLLPQGEQGIFVPAAAVLTDSGSNASRVFVIENGRARVRVVAGRSHRERDDTNRLRTEPRSYRGREQSAEHGIEGDV